MAVLFNKLSIRSEGVIADKNTFQMITRTPRVNGTVCGDPIQIYERSTRHRGLIGFGNDEVGMQTDFYSIAKNTNTTTGEKNLVPQRIKVKGNAVGILNKANICSMYNSGNMLCPMVETYSLGENTYNLNEINIHKTYADVNRRRVDYPSGLRYLYVMAQGTGAPGRGCLKAIIGILFITIVEVTAGSSGASGGFGIFKIDLSKMSENDLLKIECENGSRGGTFIVQVDGIGGQDNPVNGKDITFKLNGNIIATVGAGRFGSFESGAISDDSVGGSVVVHPNNVLSSVVSIKGFEGNDTPQFPLQMTGLRIGEETPFTTPSVYPTRKKGKGDGEWSTPAVIYNSFGHGCKGGCPSVLADGANYGRTPSSDGSYGSGGGCLYEIYGEGARGGRGGNPYICIGW